MGCGGKSTGVMPARDRFRTGRRRETDRAARLRAATATGLVAFALMLLIAPSIAGAAEVQSIPATTSAVVTIEGYDVDFTLPTAAKAGCMVCHGDAGLSRLRDGEIRSYYVDPATLEGSSHASVQCVGCHLDFAFKAPHSQLNGNAWQLEARSACKNCHKDQALDYGSGSHRIEILPGGERDPKSDEKPLCGDCHGNHAIDMITDNPAGRAALHADGWQVCGRCHEDYWESYDDYYHGAAYKRGAKDAPACWDCHGWHKVLPVDDRDSLMNERHIVETCSKCHPGAGEGYVEYAAFIHGRQDVKDKVFLVGWMSRIRDVIGGLFGR